MRVDSGVIVISNDRLEPIAALGSRVVTVTASPEDAQLAYLEAGAEGAVGGTLFTVDARGQDEPRQVASDVCAVQYLTLGERRKLSYNEQRELESLPAHIDALEAEQLRLRHESESTEFYKESADHINAVLARLEQVAAELEAALERWVLLDERR